VRGKPARKRLEAIGLPIIPRPMKPTLRLVDEADAVMGPPDWTLPWYLYICHTRKGSWLCSNQ
jgi:hypothetical protein